MLRAFEFCFLQKNVFPAKKRFAHPCCGTCNNNFVFLEQLFTTVLAPFPVWKEFFSWLDTWKNSTSTLWTNWKRVDLQRRLKKSSMRSHFHKHSRTVECRRRVRNGGKGVKIKPHQGVDCRGRWITLNQTTIASRRWCLTLLYEFFTIACQPSLGCCPCKRGTWPHC